MKLSSKAVHIAHESLHRLMVTTETYCDGRP